MQVKRIIDGAAASHLMEPLTALVVKAGEAILAVNRAAMRVDGKQDGSPVTEADLAADRIIADGLAQLAGDVPTLSEERTQLASPPFRDSFFLIDPLDGTKEFVAGRDEFTVNLALVTEGVPLLGIVSRARARAALARHRRPRRRARQVRRHDHRCCRTDPHPHAADAGRALDRGGEPFPWRPQKRGVHRSAAPMRSGRRSARR